MIRYGLWLMWDLGGKGEDVAHNILTKCMKLHNKLNHIHV